jgi:hypothetical protein
MAAPPLSHDSLPGLSETTAQPLRLAVQEVLSSPTFQRSPRLRQLLTYIAHNTIKGDTESLKEPIIGQRVFSRPANYSAAEDNIVRSNVRQLRARLDEYYSGPGANAAYRLAIPKGSYSISLVAVEPVPAVASSRNFTRPKSLAAFAAALLLLLVGAFYLGRRTAPVLPGQSQPHALLSLLDPSAGQRLLVVVPDADLQLYQNLSGRPVQLEDYINRQFLTPEGLRGLPPVIASDPNQFFDRELTQGFVLRLIPHFTQTVPPSELSVRHPRTLSVKDFERDNALLISGPWGDPWVQLFDRTLNFQVVVDPSTHRTRIVNRHPRPGEQSEYYNFTDPSTKTVVCYARLAYLPGLSPSNRVLLAGGPHAASTQAASLFLTRPDSLDTVLHLFHTGSPRSVPWFELLVEARAISDAPWTMRIVASRAISTPTR